MFLSLIDSNLSLSDIMKFHYLKASLHGEALKIVQSVNFSAQNYIVAWQILCNRYDNTRLLVFNHIRLLFTLEPLTRESAAGLRQLNDGVFEYLKCLNALGEPTDKWDSLLIYLIFTKLDRYTAREWEKIRTSEKEKPTLVQLQQFLMTRAEFLENVDASSGNANKHENKPRQSKVTLLSSNSKGACNFCSNSKHLIYNCPDFIKLSVQNRIQKVNELKLCHNYLCTNKHELKDCKTGNCRVCKARHSSLLHLDGSTNSAEIASSSNNETCPTQNAINLFTILNKYVLLSTVSIYIFDTKGNKHNCKAILNSGSQSHFISQRLCSAIQLKQFNSNVAVTGINNITSPLDKRCNVTIQSRINSFNTSLSCFLLTTIAENINGFLNIDS